MSLIISEIDPEDILPELNNKTKSKKAIITEYRQNNKEYFRKYGKNWRANNKEYILETKRKYSIEIRLDGILAYGGKCVCCGEIKEEFLTIDHINGRDTSEKVRLSGQRLWQKLRSLGYPKDEYRLLCYNCNCARGARGYCPHEKEEDSYMNLRKEDSRMNSTLGPTT